MFTIPVDIVEDHAAIDTSSIYECVKCERPIKIPIYTCGIFTIIECN